MTDQKTRISRGLAVIIDSVLVGSHSRLNSLFLSAGAPGPVPEGSHAYKWQDWIIAAGRDPNVDNFYFIGTLIEEFMDVRPLRTTENSDERIRLYEEKRKRIEDALAAEGLQYFHGGRIIPTGVVDVLSPSNKISPPVLAPSSLDEVLTRLLRGLHRAMFPLTHRRKGLPTLAFDTEYDVQDLMHVLLRPWVKDIRPEEYTPSYAGKSTRMDFLLAEHSTVLEMKFVRDVSHGKNIGHELLIDIGHYRQHPRCDRLWCAVFDPDSFLVNGEGLAADLAGLHRQDAQQVEVKVFVL